MTAPSHLPALLKSLGIALGLALALLAFSSVATTPAAEGATKKCKQVSNPYPNSRYAGADLKRIRAENVSCRKARRVARGAHAKAMRTFSLRYTWRRWKVRSDLSGPADKYVAWRGTKRVRWVFS